MRRWTTISILLGSIALATSVLKAQGRESRPRSPREEMLARVEREGPQPPPFNVRTSGHPRLFFTGDDLPRLRKLPHDLSTAKALLTMMECTEEYRPGLAVKFQLPPRQPGVIPEPKGWTAGHFPYWTGMANLMTGYMDALTCAAIYTEKPEYVARAKEYLLAFCRWTTWTDPQEPVPFSLSTRYIATAVVLGYDSLFDHLTEAERVEVEDAMLHKGCEVFSKGVFWDPRNPSHSPQWPGECAPMGLMALAMFERRPEARPYLGRCWQQVKMSLDTQLTTPHSEGFMYANAAFEPMVNFGDALARTTGETSIVTHPYLKRILPYWLLYFTAPGRGGLPNFGDSAYYVNLDPMLKVSQAYIQDPRINQYLAEHYRPPERKLASSNCSTPVGPCRDYADLPLDRAFNMGWVAMRSAWHDPHGALLAFTSSPSTMGHSHFDANSFVVNVAGEWLATDPGYDAVGPKATEGHNSLLVDGHGQVKKGGGKITGFFTSPDVAYAVGDASASYRADLLKTFRRHVLYVRPDYWLILDELESNGPPRDFAALLEHRRQWEVDRQRRLAAHRARRKLSLGGGALAGEGGKGTHAASGAHLFGRKAGQGGVSDAPDPPGKCAVRAAEGPGACHGRAGRRAFCRGGARW